MPDIRHPSAWQAALTLSFTGATIAAGQRGGRARKACGRSPLGSRRSALLMAALRKEVRAGEVFWLDEGLLVRAGCRR